GTIPVVQEDAVEPAWRRLHGPKAACNCALFCTGQEARRAQPKLRPLIGRGQGLLRVIWLLAVPPRRRRMLRLEHEVSRVKTKRPAGGDVGMAVETQNSSLSRAKINKEDEFYTQLEDVERELKHYRK